MAPVVMRSSHADAMQGHFWRRYANQILDRHQERRWRIAVALTDFNITLNTARDPVTTLLARHNFTLGLTERKKTI